MQQLEFSNYAFVPDEKNAANQTHLLITLDRIEYCLDLSLEYRHEKLRREFDKYNINKDALFEWYLEIHYWLKFLDAILANTIGTTVTQASGLLVDI